MIRTLLLVALSTLALCVYGMSTRIIIGDSGSAGLVVWLPMDDVTGTTTHDRTGNGYSGIMYNSPEPRAGKSGQCFRFNGVTNRNARIAIHTNAINGLSSGSISLWARPLSATNSHIASRWGDPFHFELTHRGEGSNVFHFAVANTTPARIDAFSSVVADLNNWYFLAATWSPTSISIYVNGQLSKTTSVTGTLQTTGNDPVTIAARGEFTGGVYFPFSGDVDDFRLFNRVLSHSEIRTMYQSKAAIYDGG